MQSAVRWRTDFRGLNLCYKILGEAISHEYLPSGCSWLPGCCGNGWRLARLNTL